MSAEEKVRLKRLKSLQPVEAVQSWLDGEFGMGDEPPLLDAIRKDTRITLSDEEIENCLCNAMEANLTAAECLERLSC